MTKSPQRPYIARLEYVVVSGMYIYVHLSILTEPLWDRLRTCMNSEVFCIGADTGEERIDTYGYSNKPVKSTELEWAVYRVGLGSMYTLREHL